MSVTIQINDLTGLKGTTVLDQQGKMGWPWLQWIITVCRLLQFLKVGGGSPLGTVSAPVGTLFVRLDGRAGTTLYVKEAGGSTNAGWSPLVSPAGLGVYANNAAAVAAGLTVGRLYRTGTDPDLVCVVH